MRDPWLQLLTESDSEFRAFDQWLRAAPRYVPPEPALAARHDWAMRAKAYDQLHDAPQDLPGQLTEIVGNLTLGALVESRRWLADSVRSTSPPDPRLIAKILDTVARLQEVAIQSRAETQDFSTLTDDELWVIDEARRLAEGR